MSNAFGTMISNKSIYIHSWHEEKRGTVMFVEDTVFMYGNSSSRILQLITTQPYIPTFVIQWNLSWTVTHWPLDRLVWSVDSQPKRQSRVLVPYYPKEPKLDSWFIQNSFHSRWIRVLRSFCQVISYQPMGGLFLGGSPMHKVRNWQDTSSSPSCPQQAASGLMSCTWSEKYCRCVKGC